MTSWENFYRRLALEARERALQARSASTRAAFERVAAEWSELADWVERQHKTALKPRGAIVQSRNRQSLSSSPIPEPDQPRAPAADRFGRPPSGIRSQMHRLHELHGLRSPRTFACPRAQKQLVSRHQSRKRVPPRGEAAPSRVATGGPGTARACPLVETTPSCGLPEYSEFWGISETSAKAACLRRMTRSQAAEEMAKLEPNCRHVD
jgi:hypothetical protein